MALTPPSTVYPKLGHGGDNWVTRMGGLPDLIERIAKHLHYEKGKSESVAIATAVNACKYICATGDLTFPGIQKVKPKYRGEACAAIAEFKAKAGASDAKTKAKALGHLS